MASSSNTEHETASWVLTAGTDNEPEVTFTTLWAEALRKFQQSAEVNPTRWDSLVQRMTACSNVDDMVKAIEAEGTVQKLERFYSGDPSRDSKWRAFKHGYLKPAVQALLLFNDALAEFASHFPVVPGGKAIFVAFGVLLQASSGVGERCEILIGLFEKLNHYLENLSVRLATPSSLGPASKTIAITILAHLLNIILIATKLFARSAWHTRITLYRQALTKDKEMKGALDRLHTLAELETRAMTAEMQVTSTRTHDAMMETRAAVSDLRAVAAQMAYEIAIMREALCGVEPTHAKECSKVDASKILEILDRVEPADIDAQNSNGCLAGTRVNVLQTLRNWSLDSSASMIYWLNGMAGIGKSAIARSFCHQLRRDNLLGGSFFCSRRGLAEQADARRIIPTLAVSLALRDSKFNAALLTELETHPFSRHWNLEAQIEYLLHNPYSAIGTEGVATLPVFVVDALDECSDEHVAHQLLEILVKGRTLSQPGQRTVQKKSWTLPLRFFLTSRPEPHIRRELESLHPSLGQVLRLHDIEKDIVEADIHLYLTHGLQDMRTTVTASVSDWPRLSDITALTRLSGRLFIYAFTALMYLRKNPVERLAKLTGVHVTVGRALYQSLDDIYGLVLSEAMNPEGYEDDEIDLTRRMMAIIVSLREPLTVVALARLLQMPIHRVRGSLDRLHAVIYIPVQDDVGCLATFHASFSDFLITSGRRPDYMVDYMRERHTYLADACLLVLQSDELCFNVSNAVTSYLPTALQEPQKLDDGLRYACQYWSAHIGAAAQDQMPRFSMMLEKFFVGPKFLFWLEVLCSIGLSHVAGGILGNVQTYLRHTWLLQQTRLEKFIQDAVHFLEDFGPVMIESTPHIYLSALTFCTRPSSVYDHCISHFSNLAQLRRCPTSDPPGAISTAATVSSDGSLIAVGFDHGEIRAWNVTTDPSELIMRGLQDGALYSLAILSDKHWIIAASRRHQEVTVCIWDVRTSALVNKIQATGGMHSFTSSADGSRIALGLTEPEDQSPYLHDATTEIVRLWVVVETGAISAYLPLVGHTEPVLSIAFSPDGRYVVSGSADGTVRLWDFQTGLLLYNPMEALVLEDLAEVAGISAVSFSRDSLQFMAGASNGVISIWCTMSGTVLTVYEPHNYPTAPWLRSPSPSISVSNESLGLTSNYVQDGRRVDVVELSSTIRLWDPLLSSQAHVSLQDQPYSFDFVNASADGRHLVTCDLQDDTVCLWCSDIGLDNDEKRRYTFAPDTSCAIQSYPCETACPSTVLTRSSPSSVSPNFHLGGDGWIRDISCDPPRLLLWVPEDIRMGPYQLYLPPVSLVISPYETWSLDLSKFAHGTRWTECYQGKPEPAE